MMVVITSCTPRQALSAAGTSAHSAPAAAPASRARSTWTGAHVDILMPTTPAAMPPATNWPSTPMLNRPAWKATATARPPNSSGVIDTSVSAKGR